MWRTEKPLMEMGTGVEENKVEGVGKISLGLILFHTVMVTFEPCE